MTRPGADKAPQGTVSGVAEIDDIIAALLTGDVPTLTSLTQLTTTTCTTLQGVGLSPPCANAPGSPPDGSSVQAFPLTGCEGEWTYDVAALFTRLVASRPRLFAVIAIDTPHPVGGIPGQPLEDNHILLRVDTDPAAPKTVVLTLSEGRIVSQVTPCNGNPPELQLPADGPYQVILRGPEYR